MPIRQPINRPGTAEDMKYGSTHMASDSRTCISPLLNGITNVRAAYSAAISALRTIHAVLEIMAFFYRAPFYFDAR